MNKIINILKEQKAIPIDQFIDIALYDKKFGYYIKKNPFGKEGDFITSPLISKLFGEMLGVWCISFWESLGKPKKIIIFSRDEMKQWNMAEKYQQFDLEGKIEYVIGDVRDINLAKLVWDEVASKIEVPVDGGKKRGYRLLSIIKDEIRDDEKVTKIWNSETDKSGKATLQDRILMICPYEANPTALITNDEINWLAIESK